MKIIKAVVLAAGLSSRMGQFKPLLPYGDKKILTHLLGEISRAGINDITVVTGHNRLLIENELLNQPCKTVYNPNYKQGMHTSVIAGVCHLSEPYDAWMQFLGDQPEISSQLIEQLSKYWEETQKGIIIPSYSGKSGHPVIISKNFSEEIKNIGPAEGLRGFMKNHTNDIQYLSVSNESILFDVDTPEDYQKLLERKGIQNKN